MGIAGIVYVFASKLLVKLKIDDAVDAVPVHFFCGMWGLVATGIFCSEDLLLASYDVVGGGIFYGHGNVLGNELLGIVFIIGWTAGIMTPFFVIINALGLFRVDATEERVGLDISHHKGAAYDMKPADQADIDEMTEKRQTGHGN